MSASLPSQSADPAPTASTPAQNFSRRRFIRTSLGGLTASALLAGLPRGWVGGAYAAGDAPETADLRFGIIALTDCAPLVVAHEKGWFKEVGINSTIDKGASWAVIRDNLNGGAIQATHLLFGIPFAATMGLLGPAVKPMIIPWLLNRNGQAITLKKDLKGKVAADPKALKPFVDEAQKAGNPLSFAMTFPPGTHAMWMRYYLGVGGIQPGGPNNEAADVTLITIPPPNMVVQMKVGKMDGFCVGEPWGARSIAEDIGFTSVTTQDMWKDHPEKVLGFSAEFAEKNPKAVKAALKAVHKASQWLADLGNRKEACDIVSKPAYINCPADLILGRMLGHLDYGDGRKLEDTEYCMTFAKRNCNYPQLKYGKWWLTQFRRWGFVTGAPDYEGVPKKVLRPDIYEEAMKEIGYAHGGSNDEPETLFDGKVFDPTKPEEYAKSFEVHALKG
ncbi:MAG: ABC transporter substrate-binding protein [Verrucomicrobia bacterium]|nr:ABC transporter substrate-binding protein [Verrucomicrobiota bacterium]